LYYLIAVFGFTGLLAFLYPVGLALREWKISGTWQSLWIAIGFVLLFLGAIWDSAVIFGATDFEALYVRHFAIAPLVVGLCILYIQRYLSALKTARYLADSLAIRVQQKELELSQSYGQVLKLEVANAALTERRIFVKNVHDGVGSQLVSALALVNGGHLTQDSLAALLRSCLDDLRIVIDSLDPETTDLTELLQTLCYRMEPRFAAMNVQLVWRIEPTLSIDPLGAQVLLNILRITQEAFSNVFKHGAHTGKVELFLGFHETHKDRLRLKISSELRDLVQPMSTGNGQRNMRERASSIGGASNSGPQGRLWIVTLDLPLSN
jgi:signal transduction histidine kinase